VEKTLPRYFIGEPGNPKDIAGRYFKDNKQKAQIISQMCTYPTALVLIGNKMYRYGELWKAIEVVKAM